MNIRIVKGFNRFKVSGGCAIYAEPNERGLLFVCTHQDPDLLRDCRRGGFPASTAACETEIREACLASRPHFAVLFATGVRPETALTWLATVKHAAPSARVMMVGHPGPWVDAALLAGAEDVLSPPVTLYQILAAFAHKNSVRVQPRSLPEAKGNAIETAVAACHGNISAAARMLGVSRRTIQRNRRRGEGK